MPFRASDLTLSDALRRLKSIMLSIKSRAISMNADSSAGILSWRTIMDAHEEFVASRDAMVEAAATPGLVAYAKVQEDDTGYDVVAEYNLSRAALNSVGAWIESNVPDGAGDGFVDNLYQYDVYTAAQTSVLRTRLDTLIASID